MTTTTLCNFSEEQYGEFYKVHLLEQYKMYVEMVDRVSQRRQTANTFFVAINASLTTFYSLFNSSIDDWRFLVSSVGIITSILWFFIILSYKQLNTGKFKVIHELEQLLPLSVYAYEWFVLSEGKKTCVYWPMSHIEAFIPLLFVVIYIVLFFV